MSKKKEMLVLHLEDSAKDSELVEAKLAEEGFNCSLVRVENERDFISALEGTRFDLILADYSLPSFDGLSALKISLEKRPEVPFIFISGAIGEEFAIEMLKSGATDYVLKNRMSRLAPAVNRALQAAKNRIERNLIESERLLLAVAIESTADAVMITDPGWNIKYVNSSFERITSLSKEEVLGRDFGLMWNGQDQSFNHVKDTLQKDDSWSGKITNQRKDATPYEADTTISSVKSPQGEVVNYVAVLRDITEKKRLESIAETVSISENIGHFSSGIRHEIGNPINSIKIRLGLLKDKILGHLYEESLGLIERIDGDLARAEYILRALKYYNFFENPELKKIDMPALIDSIASIAKTAFSEKKINLEIKISPGVRWGVLDPRAFHQVLLNVLANAADACAGREDPKIKIELLELDRYIIVRISDNGSGISAEDTKNIFKPFFTTKIGGTGLGLTIVKKMLSKMNCPIEIVSEKGIGTSVDIIVPRALD